MNDMPSPESFAKVGSKGVVAVAVLLFVIAIFSSYSLVSPGNTGVVFNIWTGSLRTVPQGIVWRMPWVTRVQSYPTALRTYTMVRRSGEGSSLEDDSIDLPTLEGQHIRQDISATYNTSEELAGQVFKSFRGADIEDIESTFIRRSIITVAQNIAGQMSLSEVISIKRSQFQEDIQTSLAIELKKMGFQLDKINLGASHLPVVIEEQMQKKMAAQQEAQQAEYELQKQQMLAKATVAKATGDSEAIVVRAKAEAEANKLVQATLNANIIQNKSVEKWNGVLPQVTGSAVPFIDLKPAKGE